ncbi:hypothetical protein SRHO_G00200650 [Serrasalmus rhombeus]
MLCHGRHLTWAFAGAFRKELSKWLSSCSGRERIKTSANTLKLDKREKNGSVVTAYPLLRRPYTTFFRGHDNKLSVDDITVNSSSQARIVNITDQQVAHQQDSLHKPTQQPFLAQSRYFPRC